MNVTVTSDDPAHHRADCVVVAVHSSRALGEHAQTLDKASRGQLSAQLKLTPVSGKLGEIVTLYGLRGIKAPRVVLAGCGPKRGIDTREALRLLGKVAAELVANGSASASVYLDDVTVSDQPEHWFEQHLVQSVTHSAYRFDETKSRKQRPPRPKLRRLQVGATQSAGERAVRRAVGHGDAIAQGVSLARDLGNRPGNVCTPSHLASRARALAKEHRAITTQVLDEAEMKRLGMGSLLSVAQGSRQGAKFIVMRYRKDARSEPPVVLIGKGVTFDSGGISIKPSASMDEMKFDMCGAASVFGVMRALVAMQLPMNVIGLVPATENLPDGQATKPGDVVTSMSGQTIEILNTDAEGRLILCDALTYATRFKPAAVIDIATLTGACVIALGAPASGLFSNDDALAEELLRAGSESGDRAWRMPLWPEYDEQLKSNFADMANVGGREAGAVTAACFLARFSTQLRWAHLDIAGAAWNSGSAKGATGRPVPLLCQYLINRSEQ